MSRVDSNGYEGLANVPFGGREFSILFTGMRTEVTVFARGDIFSIPDEAAGQIYEALGRYLRDRESEAVRAEFSAVMPTLFDEVSE